MILPYALGLAPTFFHPISLPESDIKLLLHRGKDRLSIRAALVPQRHSLSDEELEDHWTESLNNIGIRPNMILWVREYHRIWFEAGTSEWLCAYNDGELRRFATKDLDNRTLQILKHQSAPDKVRAPNIMPKAFSRIFLSINSISDQWRCDLREDQIIFQERITPSLLSCGECRKGQPCLKECRQSQPDWEQAFDQYWSGRYPLPVNVKAEYDWMAVIDFSYVELDRNHKPRYKSSHHRESLLQEPA